MLLVPVQVWVPVVVVAQLSCSYGLAVLWFREASEALKNAGVVLAAVSVLHFNASARFRMGISPDHTVSFAVMNSALLCVVAAWFPSSITLTLH